MPGVSGVGLRDVVICVWVEFVERIEDYGAHHPSLTFDVTGPWPPYDFVRLVV